MQLEQEEIGADRDGNVACALLVAGVGLLRKHADAIDMRRQVLGKVERVALNDFADETRVLEADLPAKRLGVPERAVMEPFADPIEEKASSE